MKGSSNAAAIAEYLRQHPSGATAMELARHLDTSGDSAVQSLERLLSRDLVKIVAGSRMSAVWTLVANEPTPPIFRAMETLQAMQEAARQT
jgi:DNA-binding IclR family transcriptional regulator